MGNTRQVVACAIVFACAACGTGDTKVDPGDLELRDLLGVSPDVAASWDSDQRESARHVLLDHLDDTVSDKASALELVDAPTREQQLARSLAKLDARRFADGDGALGLVVVDDAGLRELPAPSISKHPAVDVNMQLSEKWGTLDSNAKAVLADLAIDAGYHDGLLVVSPEPRLAVIAAYAPGHLVVNPVLLAAFDPELVELPRTTESSSPPKSPLVDRKTTAAAGNPYSFYGSINECAYAQRLRCESCLPNNNCSAVTTSDGNTECTTLAADDGRGYFLLCINLSLAISSVDDCTADKAPGCSRVTDAASDLNRLDANATFLTDSSCTTGLDSCLAKIYGPSSDPFPGIVDGGVSPPPSTPPRDTEVSCGDSCDDNNNNCDASPSCDCSGPSCNNSLSCDSACSNSNTQSGCGGGCDSCSDDSGGGGGGGTSSGGSSGCGGDSGGGTSSGGSSGCGGGCSSDSGGGGGGSTSSGGSSGCGGGCSSDSGGGGGGTSSGGSSGCGGGGGCSGGGDSGGGSSGGGSSGCSGGGGGGGGGGCQVVRRDPSPAFAVALSLTWALLPIPLAAAIRRRSRKRNARASSSPNPESDDHAGGSSSSPESDDSTQKEAL